MPAFAPRPLAALAAATVLGWAPPALAWNVTWLGHAGFLIEAKDGTRVLIDPWTGNPKFPKGFKLPETIDGILVTHGHFDHSASANELSAKHKAPIVGVNELLAAIEPKDGPKGIGGNVGGTVKVGGIQVTMVPAVHSSSAVGAEGAPAAYTGNPLGFVLRAKGENTLYHAGDTGLTHDFIAIRDAYKPAIALLPIGGHFTMGPQEAAVAARYLGVGRVVPMHYGTFPLLAGTPAQLRTHLGRGIAMNALQPGKPVQL